MKRRVIKYGTCVLMILVGINCHAQDSTLHVNRNKLFIELGIGPAVAFSPPRDTMHNMGFITTANIVFNTKNTSVLSLHYSKAHFEDKHPQVESMFGYKTAPEPHTIEVYSLLAGKSFVLHPHSQVRRYDLRVSAGPGYAKTKRPENIRAVQTNAAFFGTLNGYKYTVLQREQVGVTLQAMLSISEKRWLNLSIGSSIHINPNPDLRNGNIYIALGFGRVR